MEILGGDKNVKALAKKRVPKGEKKTKTQEWIEVFQQKWRTVRN